MMDFAELDAIAEDYWQPGGQPSLAFGVVRDGELVHSGGFGQRFLGGPAPDADTVFRISSMWADRQEGLPLDDFSALLSGGVSFA
jgi:CubicO group peptidase (beta-lactamase class C family)